MPTLTIEPFPAKNDLVQSKDDLSMSSSWQRWLLLALVPRVQQAAPSLVTVKLASQSASIGTTALVPLASGTYRLNWYMRIVQAATTSSSFTLSALATDGAVNVTQSGTAATGNTTGTIQSGMLLVRSDASTPLSYAVTYASVGGTPMKFDLTLILEGLL